MLNENEQDALSKIKAYIDAGHSFDAIRQAGWASWIDHLEAKGYDLRTVQLALRPPEETPLPDDPVRASDEGTHPAARLHDEASLETEDEQLTQAQRDELLGTAFVSPWWIVGAPGPIRLLLTLATLPGIVLGLVMFLLTPFGWLVNVLTGHRFNSTWGLRIIQMFRTAILLIGPTWLLSLLLLPLAGVYLGWMLVYLVLRQFNGAADQERRMYAAMDMEDEMLERLKRE